MRNFPVIVLGLLACFLLCSACTDRTATGTAVVTEPTSIIPGTAPSSSGHAGCPEGSCDLPWTGTWALSGGDHPLVTFSQKGVEITGKTEGISLYGTTTGTPPKLSGTWKGGDGKEGWFWFDMSADQNAFHGEWFGTGTYSAINGTRK